MTDFTPSPAMLDALVESADAQHLVGRGVSRTFIRMLAGSALKTIIVYLSDPKNAEDAKNFASAFMTPMPESDGYLADDEGNVLYSVKAEQS